jgi:hypothetical protein
MKLITLNRGPKARQPEQIYKILKPKVRIKKNNIEV